ncbi:right-handed parallel beta-helix repeat-containing protein [Bradymonadaceae bacterium TMQ3]|uniref:Right-handed parallel beta-helix repeat-containing protein n=1 Tax=Lujinxingia sediminis TaxID=2480984 RepID=A0ABY0CT25_9DELT|nr:right-handed parallel beta-helix repeat-containing protein [Lujinxingia sediminis]RDV38739.1 right-handed parallel beta-helix repeat-containing protein [Bradymonadaceae bacterium TMQ3]RVU43976.1 right-handed parallel beta-helix repeat-containing protein [Lujinxingia sediminis]TXC76488.1 right-handed parallel beta-helix repeat-containing protein [Bradymonadales bacterium TMQ1]
MMNLINLKNWTRGALTLSASLALVACGDDGPQANTEPDLLPQSILEDTVLSNIVSDPSLPDYVVTESVTVQATLRVDPGVNVQFARTTRLTIDGENGGALDSRGSQDKPIKFTGEDKAKGAWDGIHFVNSTSSQNNLRWTTIEFAGDNPFGNGLRAANLSLDGGSTLFISNSTIRESARYGIEVTPDSALTGFSQNTFSGNFDYAMRLPAGEVGKVDRLSTFSGNNFEAGVETYGGDITTSATWKPLSNNAPIAVTDTVVVKNRLDLEPGTRILFDEFIGMTIDGENGGVLVALGTEADNVVMSRLGDVIWKGLYLDGVDSNQSRMEYTTIEHAGFSGYDDAPKANLTIGGATGTSTMVVLDSTFSYSQGAGIAVGEGSSVNEDVESVNSFIDNVGADVILP